MELEKRVVMPRLNWRPPTEELESFAYSVSHDLRSPLRVIDGFCQILVTEYGPGLEGEAAALPAADQRVHAARWAG